MLGISTVNYSLSYVDELLNCFSVHPQKSIQHVFQRLLVTAGTEDFSVSKHITNTILTAIGCGGNIEGRSILTESDALQLFRLVVKYAVEIVTGRSPSELIGATRIFRQICDRLSEHLSMTHMPRIPTKMLKYTASSDVEITNDICHNNCIQLVLMEDAYLTTAFASCLTIENLDIEFQLKKLFDDGLQCMLEDYRDKATIFPIKTEYFQTIFERFLTSDMQIVCHVTMCKLIASIVYDPTRDTEVNRRPLRPMMWSIMTRKRKNRDADVHVSLERLFGRIAEAIRISNFKIEKNLDSLIYDCQTNWLSSTLLSATGEKTSSIEGCFDVLKQVPKLFISPLAVANLLLYYGCASERADATCNEPNHGRLPWSAINVATALSEYGDLTSDNWKEIIDEMDKPCFDVTSVAAAQFLHDFFMTISIEIRDYFLYKNFKHINGKLNFLEKLQLKCSSTIPLYKASQNMITYPPFIENPYPASDRTSGNLRCIAIYDHLLNMASISIDHYTSVCRYLVSLSNQFFEQVVLGLCQSKYAFPYGISFSAAIIEHFTPHGSSLKMLQYLLTLQDVETNKMEIVHDEIVRAIVKNRELRMSNIPLQERISYTTDLLQYYFAIDPLLVKQIVFYKNIKEVYEYVLAVLLCNMVSIEEWLNESLRMNERNLLEFIILQLTGEEGMFPLNDHTKNFYNSIAEFGKRHIHLYTKNDMEQQKAILENWREEPKKTKRAEEEKTNDIPVPVHTANYEIISTSDTSDEESHERETQTKSEEVQSLFEPVPMEQLQTQDFTINPKPLAQTKLEHTLRNDATAEIDLNPVNQEPSLPDESAIQARMKECLQQKVESHKNDRPPDIEEKIPSAIGPPPGFFNKTSFCGLYKVMRDSGRSSSVSSSSGRTLPNLYSQAPAIDPRMQRPFGNNSQPPFNPLNSYIQQTSAQNPANMGLSNIFNTNNFGGSQELIRPPGAHNFGSNSPTNQARPGMPPAPQRQNSSSSWNIPGSTARSTGPPTPLQFDFRAQGPPTQQEFQPRAPQPLIFEGDLSQMTFSDDVQEEANGFFEAIYTHKAHLMSVPVLIDRLKNFKNSSDSRDHKLLACVVKNLFEEYKFFNDYPDRELKITAELYGGIIREGIINETANLHFATAVRKVIESLSQQPNTNLFTFGLVALEFCKTKLCTYPKVCSMIAALDNFSKFPQTIRDYVHAGMTGDLSRVTELSGGRSTPPVWTAPRVADNRSAIPGNNAIPQNRTGNSVLSYTNVDTLVKATESEGAEVAQPAEAIVDKMSFLFNNLSQTNMGAKKEEVLNLIADHGEPFIKWLAQYIVMKRVSIEQNFQPLYNTFVQVLDHPLLDLHIKKETFRNIRILLRSDKRQAASNYSDRQLLKNLGMWLGAITIARSKPILLQELDLKSLLLEAYYKGQQELLFVVPFIAKILLSCSKSPIFSPSCAWIKSILKVLAELHNEPDLKINLKFEIEVLCKELSVDLSGLPIEGVLKDTDKLVRVHEQLSEIKMLAPPNQFPSSSPVPRQGGDAIQPPGNDTKPSTPLPEGENGNGPEVPAQSHFSYHDINVISYEGLTPHLQIKSNLPLFQLHPHLKQVVRPSLTIAIKELIGPVAERAQKIAMTVTENLIRKDFAMDPNEKNLKSASFHMMRAMTAGMAMITCRDPLAVTMANSLQNAFSNALRNSVNTADSAKMIEEAAQVITQENVELATNFIVKTACEKAASEMEKRLEPEFQKRILARQASKTYVDETAQAIQNILPEQIAFQPGETPKELLDIYMQFSSRICGFKPSANDDMSPEAGPSLVVTEERERAVSGQLQMIIKEVDNTMTAQPNIGNKAFTAVGVIRDLLNQLAMNPRDNVALGNVIGKSVEHFLHAFHVDPNTKNPLDVEWPRRLRDLFIGVTRLLLNLTAINEVARKITTTIVALNVDYKWNVEAIEVLYKHSLIQSTAFDQHIASKMCSGPSVDQATFFAQRLFRALSSGDNKVQFQAAFPNTYEQLVKISQMMPGRIPVAGEPAGMNSPLLDGENIGEHELSTKVVESVLREWITMCYTPAAQRNPQDALSNMIHVMETYLSTKMHDHGCLSTDEKVSSFFKMCTEMCVEVTNKMMRNDNGLSAHQSTIIRQRCYYTLDAYVKLIALMIKYSDGNQSQTKITLLKKILSIITSVLKLDHEVRAKEFNSLPYHRIFITLFNELTSPDGTPLDQLQWNVLESFGQTLFMLQPRLVPGFAFAWLDIVGHRSVIGKLLGGAAESSEAIKMAAMYTQLIICHLKFLAPFLRNIHLPKSVALLYKGTLRVLLVILHDFPELLCEFHYVICDTIPANCVQLRNLVLSAYPRNMRLPDPFALNFKQVDAIPDMAQEPKSNLNMSTIIPDNIRNALDDYLLNRTNVDFLTTLPTLLQSQTSQIPGQKYNTTVLNAVVLYVGIKAIESLHQRRMHINIHTIAHTSYMDVFQNLAVQLCTEGRYLLFNAIANQLRYPNAHTHYFSCVFLFLFLNSDYDAIQEQITRILFERLVALRPHPWGLLITFIELIKNPVYNFWKFEFTRCAPEIERLFQNVANTCVSSSRPPNESASRAC